MASSTSFDDKLSCPICHRKYDTPKTLPCLHSFCEKCLHQHLSAKDEIKILKGFDCPTCNEFTSITAPESPIESWVDQFRTNIHLQDMVDAKLRSIAEKIPCKQHPEKTQELYCVKCKHVLCSICAVKDHLECVNIESLEDVVMARRSKLRLLSSTLQRYIDKGKTRQRNAEDMIWDLEKKEREMTAEVKEWERKVMYNVMKQTKLIIEDIDTRVAEEMESVLQWQSSIDSNLKDYVSLIGVIEGLVNDTSISPTDLLTSSQDLESRCSDLMETSKRPGPTPSTLMFFKSDWTEGNCSIGHVTLIKSTVNSKLKVDSEKNRSCSVLGETVSLTKAITCRSEEDKRDPCLLDLVVLCSGNSLVVSDSSNKCIKSFFFVDDGAITCRLPMLNPRCLAVIDEDRFVLTTESRNIYFFRVKKLITMESRVQIGTWYEKKTCYGISSLPKDCLAITFTNQPGIEIVTFAGDHVRSISLPKEHLSCCISAGSDMFAVSCCFTGTLFLLDADGDVLFEQRRNPYTCSPGGVGTDGKLVLYADCRDISVNELVGHIITPLLTEKNGLICPRAVFLAGTDKLYVADESTVKVFNYKNLSSFQSSNSIGSSSSTFVNSFSDNSL